MQTLTQEILTQSSSQNFYIKNLITQSLYQTSLNKPFNAFSSMILLSYLMTSWVEFV